jgi:DNA modification methylase
VAALVDVFREVRRVLRDDGTLWLNLGDSYAGYHGNSRVADADAPSNKPGYIENMRASTVGMGGLKPKDLIGIPWMVAFALRADGWYLRSDIIWSKPNPMPESVKDRPTKAHEYLFLLSKGPSYYYDADAVAEPSIYGDHARTVFDNGPPPPPGQPEHTGLRSSCQGREKRNRRSVWTVATQPFAEAHFATMPPALAEPCILAGSGVDGVVLDPFGGAGTTALVARRNGRRFVHVELNPEYMEIARRRLDGVGFQTSMFGSAA